MSGMFSTYLFFGGIELTAVMFVCVQVPCVAVELAVHRAVRAALGVFVVQVPPLGVLPGGPGVDRVVGVEGVSRRGYARPVRSHLTLPMPLDGSHVDSVTDTRCPSLGA